MTSPAARTASLHARVAAFSRSRPLDDPDYTAARRDLAALQLERHIERVTESSPSFTDGQRDRLIAALGGAR